QHIEHPSDRTFDGEEATKHAIDTLRGATKGSVPLSRKIDDKMSYQVKRDASGKVGVKYKGPGSHYNYSNEDIDTQHGHKPYLAHPLKQLLEHLPKVLPKRAGEYQGGYMSSSADRKILNGRISHKPNTIEYSVPTDTEEGKKLQNSKVSTVIHSELKGPDRKASSITDTSEFRQHPDVHQVSPIVSHDEQHNVDPVTKRQVLRHLDQADKLSKNHSSEHLAGHEQTLRTYINSTVRSGETPSTEGYMTHLTTHHQKLIDAVKLDKTKQAKTATMKAALAHVKGNKKAFDKSLQIHGHVQAATNLLARGLSKTAHGGYHHAIEGQETGPEGFVANGLKIVDRGESGFSRANLARSAILKASPKLAKKV
ncbi:MAG: DUF6267 family protein, partial [Actinomycetes bacterium]